MKYLLTILLLFSFLFADAQLKTQLRRYTMDNLTDSSGNGQTLKAYGNAQFSTANKIAGTGSGLLDIYTGYWRVPLTNLGTQGIISYWVYTTSLVAGVRAVIAEADPADFFYIYTQESTNMRFTTTGGNRASAGTISTSAWINYVWYFNSTSGVARLWQDGARVTLADSIIATGFNTTDSIFIGVDYYRNANWVGNIDEVLMYTGFAPTESQIDSIYSLSYMTIAEVPYVPTTLVPYYNGVEKIPSYNGILKYMNYNAVPPAIDFDILTMYDATCPSGGNRLTDHDCADVTFTYAPVRALKTADDYATKKYIDPTYSGTESGTITQPYNSWSDITWASNTTYLQKAGTTHSRTGTLTMPSTVTNILISSYGTGVQPQIIKTTAGDVFWVETPNVTFRGMDISSPASTYVIVAGPPQASQNNGICIRAEGGTAENLDIYDCTLHDASTGVFAYSIDVIRIINCEIYDQYLDGIWLTGYNFFEASYNNIYNVNKAFEDYPSNQYLSPGDGIQCEYNWKESWIHHNTIDRSSSGNKQTLMMNTTPASMLRDYIEFNTLVNPLTTGQGVSGTNLHLGSNHTFAHNTVYSDPGAPGSPATGLWSEATNDSIYGNVFYNCNTGIIVASGNALIDNNTFYGNVTGVNNTVTVTTYRNNIQWGNTNNYTGTAPTTSATNLTTIPGFIDQGGYDFHIGSGSSAVNAGTAIGWYKVDRDGHAIVGDIDIGAYEYIP